MTTHTTTRRARPRSGAKLPAPSLAAAKDGVINPAWNKVVITVKPYPMMTCGDEVLLLWHGLNSDGEPYRHEVRRFVTERQVGREVAFVVREPHIAELDSGSVEISCRVTGKKLPTPMDSERLQLVIGDVPPQLLPAIANDAVGGSLDPNRVPDGTGVTIRPYSRMAAGDRLILIGSRNSEALWRDVLDIEAHSVGREVSFWIDHLLIAPHVGHELTLTYDVRRGHSLRQAEPLSVHIGPLVRPALKAPQILGLNEGTLDVDELRDGVTMVIDDAGFEAGEVIWLQCDGRDSHSRDREITEATAGQPVIFVVPSGYWESQRGRSVRVWYQVERRDDVSQRFAGVTIQVRSGAES